MLNCHLSGKRRGPTSIARSAARLIFSGMVYEMSLLDIVSVVGIAVLVVVVVGMGRMGWRIWYGNEEMEAGGSMGDQMLGTKNKGAFSKRKRRAKK